MVFVFIILSIVNIALLWRLSKIEDALENKEVPTPNIYISPPTSGRFNSSSQQTTNANPQKKTSNEIDISNFKPQSSSQDDWLNSNPSDSNL